MVLMRFDSSSLLLSFFFCSITFFAFFVFSFWWNGFELCWRLKKMIVVYGDDNEWSFISVFSFSSSPISVSSFLLISFLLYWFLVLIWIPNFFPLDFLIFWVWFCKMEVRGFNDFFPFFCWKFFLELEAAKPVSTHPKLKIIYDCFSLCLR
jgi:hypothetical protein